MNNRNNVYFGIGMAMLCALFVYGILGSLVNWGDKIILRERTTALIAICANLLLLQHFRSRFMNEALRGVALATVAMAMLWLFIYGKEIFNNS
jgi:hypothetical protein